MGSAEATETGLPGVNPGLHSNKGPQKAHTGHWKGQNTWCFGRDPQFLSNDIMSKVTD